LKKTLLLISTFICLFSATAQSPIPNNEYYDTKIFHFGYLLGFSQTNFKVDLKNNYKLPDSILGLQAHSRPGFTVGIVTNLRMHDYLDLRFIPTLTLGSRNLNYFVRNQKSPRVLTYIDKQIESTIVDLPIEIKWKAARIMNYRPYVVGGVKYSIDMASNARKKADNDEEVLIKLLPTEFAYFVGVGFEFYLPYSNKIAIELKSSFGLNNILKFEDNIYTNCVDRLTSKNTFISITFE
jgi:hypothetical protein